MPVFKTTPSRDLTSSIRRAVAAAGENSPLAEMQADAMAATTAQHMGLAEKARAEAEAIQRAEAARSNPAVATEYAGNVAGMDVPSSTRLAAHLRGQLEQPTANDDLDASMRGAEAQPFVTGAPVLEPGQRRLFQSALASTIANRMATGKTSADQLAHAGDRINETALANEAANTADVPTANRLIAAISGKIREPFKTNAQGTVLNEETGALNEGTQLAGAVRRNLTAQAGQRNAAAAAGGGAPAGDVAKTGPDYLASLTPDMAKTVKAVAEGRTPLTNFSTKGGHREQILRMAMQYDPTYNATRANAWKEYTTGATSKNVIAINTAIGHMGTLDELADALKNKDTKILNRIFNTISNETGKPEVNNFATARQAVGEELMRTFRQVGASEHEATAWANRFDAASSPEQLKGAVKTAAELLHSRIVAVDDNWKRATQSKEGFPDLLSPKSKAVMEKLAKAGKALAPAALSPTNAKGWKLMVDGKGNKAYVGPNNEIEEVQ